MAVIQGADVPLSVRDIAYLAAVPPSTAHRVVAALAKGGTVRRRRVRGDPRVYVERTRGRPTAPKPTSLKTRLDRLFYIRAPVWVLRPKDLPRYGIPRQIRPVVLVPERWADRLDLTGLRYATFKHTRPLELAHTIPPVVEVFLAMLQLDTSVARTMWEGGALKKTDARRLRRRLRAEQLEGPAEAIGVLMDRRRRATDVSRGVG